MEFTQKLKEMARSEGKIILFILYVVHFFTTSIQHITGNGMHIHAIKATHLEHRKSH